MHRVIITAEVDDLAKWEQGFRSHGELFKSQTVISPARFATSQSDNHIAIYAEVEDLNTLQSSLGSTVAAEAMDLDGIKQATVKMFILDKEFRF